MQGRGKLYQISFHKFMPARVLAAGITWFGDLCSPHTRAVEGPLSTFLLLSPLLQHPSVQIHRGGSLQGINKMVAIIAWNLIFHRRLISESHILTGIASFLLLPCFCMKLKISLPETIMTMSNLFTRSINYFITEEADNHHEQHHPTMRSVDQNCRMPGSTTTSNCPLSMCFKSDQSFYMT